jgi:hypothetical protein
MSNTSSRVQSAGEIARNARLDALAQAVTFWADKQRQAINNRVASSKNILKGRTGSERLAQSNVQGASDLVVSSLDAFLLTQ